jgi:hypothetical protein
VKVEAKAGRLELPSLGPSPLKAAILVAEAGGAGGVGGVGGTEKLSWVPVALVMTTAMIQSKAQEDRVTKVAKLVIVAKVAKLAMVAKVAMTVKKPQWGCAKQRGEELVHVLITSQQLRLIMRSQDAGGEVLPLPGLAAFVYIQWHILGNFSNVQNKCPLVWARFWQSERYLELNQEKFFKRDML